MNNYTNVLAASEFFEKTLNFISTKGIEFGVNLISALVIFFIGKWIAKLITRIVGKLAAKSNIDETLVKFIVNILYTLLLAFVVLAAMNRLGVDTTSFVAIVAAAGFAIGFALQSSLGNFASGVMLILFKPFQVGDYIEAGGSTGVVEEIQIFNTMLRTFDNVLIIVPNGSITGGTITNYSARETRRIDLVVGCGYEDDLKAVKNFLEGLLATDERILKDPEPIVAVNELGDSSVNFIVRPWVKSSDYWQTRWALTEEIKLGFDKNGFHIPYPTQDLHVHNVA